MIRVNGKIVEQNRFFDGTLSLKFDSNIERGCYTEYGEFYQNKNYIEWLYDSDSEIFTIMSIVDIIRRNGGEYISLTIPYLCNSRMDRIKSPTENFSLKVFANWLNSLNLNEVRVMNVHSNVSEALINNIVSELPEYDVMRVINEYRPDVIFFPDEGACKRYSDMVAIKNSNLPITFGIKKRDWKTAEIKGLDVIGGEHVQGKRVLIVDDICSQGGTFKFSSIKLKELGATDVALYVTHCEDNIQTGDLLKTDLISKIYTTDTILHIKHPKLVIVNKYR